MSGYDREGSPVWFDVIGPLDPKGLLMSASKQDYQKTKIQHAEMLQQECRRQSEKVFLCSSSGSCPQTPVSPPCFLPVGWVSSGRSAHVWGSAGEERGGHHADLRLRRPRAEAHLETCHRDIRRGWCRGLRGSEPVRSGS